MAPSVCHELVSMLFWPDATQGNGNRCFQNHGSVQQLTGQRFDMLCPAAIWTVRTAKPNCPSSALSLNGSWSGSRHVIAIS